MTGHLAVPALEADPEKPATLSQSILCGLLRGEMGFEGLVVTDSLDMGGVARHYALGEASVQAILAGADLLLQAGAPDAALAALRDAAKSGRLPIERIDQSVTRVLRAKARVGLHRNRFVDLESLPRSAGPRGIRASRRRDRQSRRHASALYAANSAVGCGAPAEAVAREYRRRSRSLSRDGSLEAELRRHVDSLESLRFDTRFAPIGNFDVSSLRSYDAVILALFVRVADRKGSVSPARGTGSGGASRVGDGEARDRGVLRQPLRDQAFSRGKNVGRRFQQCRRRAKGRGAGDLRPDAHRGPHSRQRARRGAHWRGNRCCGQSDEARGCKRGDAGANSDPPRNCWSKASRNAHFRAECSRWAIEGGWSFMPAENSVTPQVPRRWMQIRFTIRLR